MTTVNNSKPRSTVSLLHLMLVLSTISILSCAAILRWFGRPDITLDSAVSLLADDLRHVQARAVLENMDLQVIFFEDGGGYEVLNANGQSIPGGCGIRRSGDRSPGPGRRAPNPLHTLWPGSLTGHHSRLLRERAALADTI
jgi:type II secretory pathway pseudopilin PulG